MYDPISCYIHRYEYICYIIKEWFFYFNHFSLIIFYHSVWLGFELFGLRVQVCSQLVQFTLACKGYDNHHCHNKPQTGNEAGVWMTSCPEEKDFSWVLTMVLRNWGPTMVLRCWVLTMALRSWDPTMVLRSWSPSMELKVDIGPWRQTVVFSTVAVAIKFFQVLTSEDELRSKAPQDVPNVGGVVSIVWYERLLRIVSLSSCQRTEFKKLINGSYLNNVVCLLCFVFPCICICIYIVVIDIMKHI